MFGMGVRTLSARVRGREGGRERARFTGLLVSKRDEEVKGLAGTSGWRSVKKFRSARRIVVTICGGLVEAYVKGLGSRKWGEEELGGGY